MYNQQEINCDSQYRDGQFTHSCILIKNHLGHHKCGECDFTWAKDNERIDRVVEAVRQDLLQRSNHGIEKYGTSLERKDLKLEDWLQHAYEECLDQANYLKCAIMELRKEL